MSQVSFELALILALIVVNGILSMSEIAIVASRKARLQKRAEEGDRRARLALALANDPDQLLSTVQVGITLVGILAGAFGGATIATHLADWLRHIAWLESSSDAVAVAIVVVAITFLSVVVGELVPKRLALSNPERIAASVAGPMRTLSRIASPAVWTLTAATNFLLKALRVAPSGEPPITEDEIKLLLRQGAQLGTFEIAEREMVERVFRLGDRRVSSLMTPRTEVDWVDLDDATDESLRKMAASGHSYFPVCQGNRDHILGIASVKRLWAQAVDGSPADLQATLLPPMFVPESLHALKLLDLLKQSGTHVALVIDEYGGFQGMVTLNDILGDIVGEVAWLGETEEPEVVQRADGSWLIDGMLPVTELTHVLNIRQLPGEASGTFETVGGFVMAHMGRIPRVGDFFQWHDLRFEVVDMDERRVDKVLVATAAPDTVAGGSSGG
ncbi:MAG: HlyC/CorC family transporter [Candidatus Schekmanbacteria bacterium]|nr:HlyC/CorC family transporter [Candidatus Schekmanbacteria bacterium]